MLTSVRWFCERTFVLWVVIFALLGWAVPEGFSWLSWSVTVPVLGDVNGILVGLGLIMFGMGMTITLEDVSRTIGNPGLVVLGVAAQYGLMPVLALGVGLAFGLPEMAVIGVLLLGCCPGGTASNVIAYLSEADVPLSVTVTLASTLLAPLVTPWLLWWYSSYWLGWFRDVSVEIPPGELVMTLVVIVVPLTVGLLLKRQSWGDRQPRVVDDVLTVGSIAIIGLIVGYVTGQAGGMEEPWTLVGLIMGSVVVHNLGGYVLGYGSGWLAGTGREQCRALSIEVGMQNSGLAVGLAPILVGLLGLEESATLLLALPGILFSIWHNVSGAMLASWWGSGRGR